MDVNKQERMFRYRAFCEHAYVPIFSQPWWLDAVCESENWDVWLCCHGDEVVAAMPYYMEDRNGLRYITKAPLTQNNGILFSHEEDSTLISRQKAEKKIIDEACEFIKGLGIDVYEQQYHYSFENWSPFYWNGYDAIPRYTYVIEDTSDLEMMEAAFSSAQRRRIRKGRKNGIIRKGLSPNVFYREHEKIFLKQGLSCPFSESLWFRLFRAIQDNSAGEIIYAETQEGDIASLMLMVWDDRSAYFLSGGSIPEFQNLETYSLVTWESIKLAHEKGLAYDFEGSMIERIAKAFREYGGTPKLYFRIRKVFDPDVVLHEAELRASEIASGGGIQSV